MDVPTLPGKSLYVPAHRPTKGLYTFPHMGDQGPTNCTFTPKAVKDAKSQNSSKRNTVQNICSSCRSCDFAFPFKGAALFAYYTLVAEASAAADAEPQKHKIVINT